MPKIDRTDLENISLIKKEFKLKNLTIIKIKKGDYEIELSTLNNPTNAVKIPNNLDENKKDDSRDLLKTKTKNDNSDNVVKSPMVGVAYLSADPASEPYIKIGSHEKQGDTILLIEAMKTFNEVKAPISGIVKEIIILNNQPVEFGDDLIIFE